MTEQQIDNYVPYGPEWEAEMNKLPKKVLIEWLKKSFQEKKELESELTPQEVPQIITYLRNEETNDYTAFIGGLPFTVQGETLMDCAEKLSNLMKTVYDNLHAPLTRHEAKPKLWYGVDKLGREVCSLTKLRRKDDRYWNSSGFIFLPPGSILTITGESMTWESEPKQF